MSFGEVNMKNVIKCDGVHKSFFANKILNGFSFTMSEGDISGILGLNGAGKTTLVRILSGILKQDEGDVEIFGLRYENNENKIKSQIGVVLGGDRSLYYKLTAKENLVFFATLYGVDKKKIDSRVEYVLDRVGLINKRDELVETFSKGMKQRLLIAKALMTEPKLLIMDEPTSGLDIAGQFQVRTLIKELNSVDGVSVLLFTHSLSEADEVCQKINILHNGRLIDPLILEKSARDVNLEKKYTIICDKRIDKHIMEEIYGFRIREEIRVSNGFQYTFYGCREESAMNVEAKVGNEVCISSIMISDLELEDYLYIQFKDLEEV